MQCANGVIHLIVEEVADLSSDLKLISGLDTAFPQRRGVEKRPFCTGKLMEGCR